MPIYEYVCQDCGAGFESLVRSGVEPHCPSCDSIKLQKQLSVFATASQEAPSPCGGCGHYKGPGSCALH